MFFIDNKRYVCVCVCVCAMEDALPSQPNKNPICCVIITIIIIIIIVYKIDIAPYTICNKIALRRFTNNIKCKTVLHEQNVYMMYTWWDCMMINSANTWKTSLNSWAVMQINVFLTYYCALLLYCLWRQEKSWKSCLSSTINILFST